jgi:hypothetical protein
MAESLSRELRDVFDGLFDPIVGHVIGSRFGAQAQVIPDILFEEALCVVGANDRVRKIEVFDHGLKLSLVVLGDLTTEDRGDLVRLADGAVGIQQSLAQLIQCGAPLKDQVVAVLHLREKEPMLTAATFAFSYRADKGFDHYRVALSIGVQKMVRADLAASGVMFTIDTETGFRDSVLINAAYGLGENIVQCSVNPDEYYVFKPSLRQGFKPILQKILGSKEFKLIYDVGGGKMVKNVPVPPGDRNRFAVSDERYSDPGTMGLHYRRPLQCKERRSDSDGH